MSSALQHAAAGRLDAWRACCCCPGTPRPKNRQRHGRSATLPRSPWFLDCLRRAEGMDTLVGSRAVSEGGRGTDGALSTTALVRVQPGVHYDGPLTLWGRDDEYWWHFYGRPFDAYSVKIVAGIVLDTPVRVVCGLRSRSLLWRPQGRSISGRSPAVVLAARAPPESAPQPRLAMCCA